MYSYHQIFKQALKIAWENKMLWFFGLFAALLGNNNGLEMISGSIGFSGQGIFASFVQTLTGTGLFTIGGLIGFGRSVVTHPVYVFVILIGFLLGIAVSLFVIWLCVTSLVGLIAKSIAFSKNKTLDWRQAFTLGIARFWPVLGIMVLVRLAGWLIILGMEMFSWLMKFPGAIFAFIIVFDIFLTLSVILFFIATLAVCGVVLKNWSFSDSLKQAWRLFKNNWLMCLELAIVLFLINSLVNSFLWFFITWILIYALAYFSTFLFGYGLVSLATLVFYVIIQIILAIFYWATWALVFEIITGKKAVLNSWLQRRLKKQ